METQNPPLLEQWKDVALQFQRAKPKTNPQLRNKIAGVLSTLLPMADVNFADILTDFSQLPSGVVGRALGTAFASLAEDRRRMIWQWVSRQDPDRQDFERTCALRGVLQCEPPTAFRCLAEIRTTPPAPTKEQRERLVSVLTGVEGTAIAPLFSGPEEVYKVRKVVRLLLTIADEPKSEAPLRVAILEGVLPTVVAFRMHTGADNCQAQVLRLLQRLPPPDLARLGDSLSDDVRLAFENLRRLPTAIPFAQTQQPPDTEGPLVPVDPVQPFPDDYAEAKSSEKSKPAPVEEIQSTTAALRSPSEEPRLVPGPVLRVAKADSPTSTPDPLAWFDANLKMLEHARFFYLEMRQQYEDEMRRRGELEEQLASRDGLEAELAEARELIQSLETRLAATADRVQSYLSDAKTAQRQAEEATRLKSEAEYSLARDRAEFLFEKEQLSRRIDAHAEKAMKDLRDALSSALSPLVRDVPEVGSVRASELGPNLLVILHHMIGVLYEKGVVLRRHEGGVR